MNIIADTNLWVRFFTRDDEEQAQKVDDIFARVDKIILPSNVLCELVWVLSFSYQFKPDVIFDRLEKLCRNPKIILKNDEVSFGLKMLQNNGDFADGINAFAGQEMALGQAASFVSFDRKAVKLLKRLGRNATAL